MSDLTKRQRQILLLMLEHGLTFFHSGTRKFDWQVSKRGLRIWAYQRPEFFLHARGLVEPQPGGYRLTAAGEARAKRLREREAAAA
jgi:hypothetical protein